MVREGGVPCRKRVSLSFLNFSYVCRTESVLVNTGRVKRGVSRTGVPVSRSANESSISPAMPLGSIEPVLSAARTSV